MFVMQEARMYGKRVGVEWKKKKKKKSRRMKTSASRSLVEKNPLVLQYKLQFVQANAAQDYGA